MDKNQNTESKELMVMSKAAMTELIDKRLRKFFKAKPPYINKN